MNYLKADVPTGLVNPGPPAHLGGRVAAAAPLLRFILSVRVLKARLGCRYKPG